MKAEQQEQALSTFRDGNVLFEQSKYGPALARYREALTQWDHPAIRFNAAVALINLDQPLEAWEHLEAALRFGDAPFDAETYKQAQLYRRLLAGQVAELEVRCDEPGAEVLLDGAKLFTGPGASHQRLKPGPHQLVAQKPGFVTETTALQLAPGAPHTETLALHVFVPRPVTLVRRFPVWLPWTVLGGGVAVALVSAPFFASSQTAWSAFDADLARFCPAGCKQADLPQSVLTTRTQGQALNGAAVGLLVVGGALTATGVVLLSLNSPHPEEPAAPTVSVVPVFSPGFAGAAAQGTF